MDMGKFEEAKNIQESIAILEKMRGSYYGNIDSILLSYKGKPIKPDVSFILNPIVEDITMYVKAHVDQIINKYIEELKEEFKAI